MRCNDSMDVENKISNVTVASNMIWRFLERFGAYVVSFVVSLVLARIFANDKGVYGSIAIVLAITAILQVFVDSGLGTALIQKKDADDVDFSTVFWFNIVSCLILYFALFLAAPLISQFYKGESLTNVIRVLGLTVVISGVKNVLQAYVSRKLMFKKFFFATLIGTCLAAFAGIFMAIKGFGVWALVAQHLINLIVDTIIIWVSIKWHPSFVFSFKRFKGLFSFGWKILVAQLLDAAYKELRTFIIGFKYSSVDLANYNRGHQFPDAIVTNINTSIDSVLLPSMSKVQDNKTLIKNMTRKSMQLSSFAIFPMMVGLAVCAPQIVNILLTEAWSDCVPYIQIFCVTFAFYPIHTANLNAIKSLGRTDIHLKLSIAKKIVGFAIIFITLWFGPIYLAIGTAVSSFISQIINSAPNKKLLNYSFVEQMKDLLPGAILSLVMGSIVYLIGVFTAPGIRCLFMQVILGSTFYFIVAKVLNFKPLNDLLDVLTKLFKHKKQGNKQ